MGPNANSPRGTRARHARLTSMPPDTGFLTRLPNNPVAAGPNPQGVTARAAAHAFRERAPVAFHSPPAPTASRDRQPASPAAPATTLPPHSPAPPPQLPSADSHASLPTAVQRPAPRLLAIGAHSRD